MLHSGTPSPEIREDQMFSRANKEWKEVGFGGLGAQGVLFPICDSTGKQLCPQSAVLRWLWEGWQRDFSSYLSAWVFALKDIVWWRVGAAQEWLEGWPHQEPLHLLLLSARPYQVYWYFLFQVWQ